MIWLLTPIFTAVSVFTLVGSDADLSGPDPYMLAQAPTLVAGPQECRCIGSVTEERRDQLDRVTEQAVDEDGDGEADCFLELEYPPGVGDRVSRVFVDRASADEAADELYDAVCSFGSACSVDSLASCDSDSQSDIPVIDTIFRWSQSDLCEETGGQWELDLASFCDFGEGMADCPPFCLCGAGEDFAEGIGCVPVRE